MSRRFKDLENMASLMWVNDLRNYGAIEDTSLELVMQLLEVQENKKVMSYLLRDGIQGWLHVMNT